VRQTGVSLTIDAESGITLGVFLVIIGIIGWILPIVPGWPALIPGLVILAEYFPPVQRLLDWARAKVYEKTGRRI
jgi:uncharacterized membrane protein YbaN (DUF454 family)